VRSTDAPDISALYRESYAKPGVRDADEFYPFPQFLRPDWIRAKVGDSDQPFRWIVADLDGALVGAAGAVQNIGTRLDGVVECFGLVVAQSARRRGFGNTLFPHLIKTLTGGNAQFVIAETRTAELGGWRIVRKCGFRPSGFEPFAHTTPAGAEAMLLLSWVAPAAAETRCTTVPTTFCVRTLARQVLKPAGLEPLSAAKHTSYDTEQMPWARIRDKLIPTDPADDVSNLNWHMEQAPIAVRRDDQRGHRFLEELGARNPHASGVVSLRRLEGEDPYGERYAEPCFVARLGERDLAAARVVWDRVDCRARILALQARFHGLQGLLLGELVRQIEHEAGNSSLTTVVDVRADHPRLQATLENLGFFPTVYYPALIAGPSGRVDAIQYTRLHGRRIGQSAAVMDNLDWPDAQRVFRAVAELAKGHHHTL
jgi:GNAT superfamily N-acetyltransferase